MQEDVYSRKSKLLQWIMLINLTDVKLAWPKPQKKPAIDQVRDQVVQRQQIHYNNNDKKTNFLNYQLNTSNMCSQMLK